MATYKVLQDIEAEDKFVGPLTLKQFILAGIALVTGYLCFFFISKNLWFLTIPLAPVLLFSAFLAIPWGRDQPTEVWLLAKIRFMLKPRRRVWDQSGLQELVTITAPKKAAEQFTGNNLSQIEVRSRLKALADTIDSRGWAIKNVNVNLYAQPGYGAVVQSTDRLVDPSTLTKEVPSVDIQASDDILDERNNPTAQHLDQMITASTQARRQETLQQMQGKEGKQNSGDTKTGPTNDFWFMHQPPTSSIPKDYTTFRSQTIQPGQDDNIPQSNSPLTADEQKLLEKRHQEEGKEPVQYGHTHVIHPIDHSKPKPKSHTVHTSHHTSSRHNRSSRPKKDKQNMTQTPDPAILNLANNDDLSVATLARQANRKRESEPHNGEVVVTLH